VTHFGDSDNVVSTAIRYGLDSSGLATPWGSDFSILHTLPDRS